MLAAQLWIYFGQSAETSDFIVDCLEAWWQAHQDDYPGIKTLAINLDGGSAVRSNRTQFIKRMAQFCQATGLKVQLIYYPPYHSKYNPIEQRFTNSNGTALNNCPSGRSRLLLYKRYLIYLRFPKLNDREIAQFDFSGNALSASPPLQARRGWQALVKDRP